MRLPAKATHAQTRQHNQRLVLRTVYDFGPISRAEVARSTGLTRTTVGDVCSAETSVHPTTDWDAASTAVTLK